MGDKTPPNSGLIWRTWRRWTILEFISSWLQVWSITDTVTVSGSLTQALPGVWNAADYRKKSSV